MTLILSGTDGLSDVDGSASTPAIRGTDTNTGIFFPAADTIAFAEGGSEVARFDSNGRLGINTTSPDALLTVNGVGAFGDGAASTPSISNTGDLNTGVWFPAADTIAFSTGGSERLRMDDNNRLLFGTTSAFYGSAGRAEFDINGSSEAILAFGTGGTAKGYLFNDGTTQFLYNVANGALTFGTNNSERARITSGGDLLVGTTTPVSSAAFVVSRSQATLRSIIDNSSSTGSEARIETNLKGKVSYFGTTVNTGNAVSYMLFQEEDGANSYYWTGNDGNFRVSTAFGDIGTNNGTVVGTQTSDERLKEISGSVSYGLSEILAIEPITFTFKDRPDFQKIGFSAQQVQPIVPEAVYDTKTCIDGYTKDEETEKEKPNSDRTKLAMDYSSLIPVLVNAVKELKSELDTVKAQNAAFEARLAALEAK